MINANGANSRPALSVDDITHLTDYRVGCYGDIFVMPSNNAALFDVGGKPIRAHNGIRKCRWLGLAPLMRVFRSNTALMELLA
ncbi:hypothetical protein PoB_006574900 [Plakobranchus ocellatus]|uniref:Uncharacterized protein n=1 Tax=Plakobranchus ocellatus TaxID=259542 RepID=A0AAV4D513_9GAST|nr:hypothetical protein PoB_006574900 [Plakobranchus ocellatus]